MQDKTWYSILGLDAEPLFLQDDMLRCMFILLFQVRHVFFHIFKLDHEPPLILKECHRHLAIILEDHHLSIWHSCSTYGITYLRFFKSKQKDQTFKLKLQKGFVSISHIPTLLVW